MTNPRLYTEAQVRELIPIGHSKYYELINSGELRSVKIGRRRYVPESALVSYVEKLESGGTEPEAIAS